MAAEILKIDPHWVSGIISALEAGPRGRFVRIDGRTEEFKLWEYSASRPVQTAILMDRYCGSSCEEFIKLAKQSWAVKTFGEPTAGVIDISNLRPWLMPSGKRMLWYATSRTLKPPRNQIDGRGIQPDFPLPASMYGAGPDQQLDFVRKVMASKKR